MTRRIMWATALVALAAGCATAPRKDYAKLYAAQPRSILVVPVVNKSVNVDAPDYFLSTVPIPVAERGYYVFPVNLVKRVLEDDGLADAGLVHGADATRLAAMFGADSVLYIAIERWDAKYVVVATQVTVEFSYVLKDGRTGDVGPDRAEDRQDWVPAAGAEPAPSLVAPAVAPAALDAKTPAASPR
jgi:hypothetical protein